jgi:fido (protein-threonine AMPylation protein)
MTHDLPIYPDAKLRTGLQFADVEKYRSVDAPSVWEKSDGFIEQMEGASGVAGVRFLELEPSRESLLQIHRRIFPGRSGAGELRQNAALPLYRGHDCPDPRFIGRSLDNFFNWLDAESIQEIHPIERAAFVLTRIVDIWPFEFGNMTMAVVFANLFLRKAGFSPFFVLPQHMKEFNRIVAQALTIETQPLVNAIHAAIRREMEGLVRQ